MQFTNENFKKICLGILCLLCVSTGGLPQSIGAPFFMQKVRIDIVGNRYGRLVVLRYTRTIDKRAYWLCLCDCGNQKEVNGHTLKATIRKGATASCGCVRVTHGHTIGNHSPEYRAWYNMKQRCYNPNIPNYKNYGAKGVTVCERWLNSFENFLADMGEKPSPKHSIERDEVYGNYEPNNCRWATKADQANNTRVNLFIEYHGQTKTLADWCRELDLNYVRVYERIQLLKWSVEDAFTKPKIEI